MISLTNSAQDPERAAQQRANDPDLPDATWWILLIGGPLLGVLGMVGLYAVARMVIELVRLLPR